MHIEDISRAFLAVLEAPLEVIHDQAFNVGRDEDVVQIREIALQVSKALDCPITFAESAGPDKRDYRVDFTKIGRMLPAFQPQWTVAQGIDELVADMSRFGLTAEDFEGPRFVRLARIRELLADGRLDGELRMTTDQECDPMTAPSLPTLRVAPHQDLRRSGHVTALRELPYRGAARHDGAVLPASCASLFVLPARATPRIHRCSRHLQRLRLLLVLQRLLGGARPPLRRSCIERLGLDSEFVRRRGSQQRRLPPAARSGSGHTFTRDRAGGQRRSRCHSPRCSFRGALPGRRHG